MVTAVAKNDGLWNFGNGGKFASISVERENIKWNSIWKFEHIYTKEWLDYAARKIYRVVVKQWFHIHMLC